jgi:photosystem II stability/assembly factor-like uncharacterized protein
VGRLLPCVFTVGAFVATASAQSSDPAVAAGMRWRLVGPFRGGRTVTAAGVPGQPNRFYFGAVGGGVWRTDNAGRTWEPIFDAQPVASIGAIAVAPSDPNVIYVGSGEADMRSDISYGNGMYKSADAGKTWTRIGLEDTRQIGQVLVDPHDPNLVFVAALGHGYGRNKERGVFRSKDGGKSWTAVLFKNDDTGAIDLAFDPSNSKTILAALWQTRRPPWNVYPPSNGPGSGLYRSEDGGDTWKQVTSGIPSEKLGRIRIAFAPSSPRRVYAIVDAKEGGLYVSEDGGLSFKRMNDDRRIWERGWYFAGVAVDPKNADTVYACDVAVYRSTDGGKTFLPFKGAPGGDDYHRLWIDPDDPRRMIVASDQGAVVTVDGGATWSSWYNQPTAQFYHVTTDDRFPYYIYGAQQDNSTIAIKSYDDDGVIGRQDWYAVGGGESGYIAPYPPEPNITFANTEAFTSRFDKRTEQVVDISVWPIDFSGNGAEKLPHRFNWTSPLMLSPHDPNTLYTAEEMVFKSTNQGQSWTAISGDLTRNDKSKQKPSGGPITLDITSVEYYDTIFALAESPLKKDMIWAGTDDGLVHLTTDGGAHWANVTPKDLPEWSMISIIEASHHEPKTAYIAVDRHKFDDFRPLIFRTRDSGKNWILTANGIPEGSYVRSVREDPKRKGLLFAGTETGVYFSVDDGGHWQPLKLNLPTVPIHDLEVHGDDLIVATHGRSFWVLDDITPLRQLDAVSANSEMVLYKPQTALRLHLPTDIERRGPVGDNPPPGAIINYYFKVAPKDEVKLAIIDTDGKVVRALSSKEKKGDEQPPEWPDQVKEITTIPAAAGMNRYAWNLRWEPPVKIPGAFYSGIGPQGPLAQPGLYTVKITAGNQSQSQPLEIVMDPRVKGVGIDDLRKQFELAMQVNDANNELHRAVNQVRTVRAEIKALQQRFENDAAMKPMLEQAAVLDKKMTPVEEQLIQVNMKGSEANLAFPNMLNEQFDSFSSAVQAGDSAPSQQQFEAFKMLRDRLDQQVAAWKQIMASDVPAFNERMKSSNIPVLYLPPEGE